MTRNDEERSMSHLIFHVPCSIFRHVHHCKNDEVFKYVLLKCVSYDGYVVGLWKGGVLNSYRNNSHKISQLSGLAIAGRSNALPPFVYIDFTVNSWSSVH